MSVSVVFLALVALGVAADRPGTEQAGNYFFLSIQKTKNFYGKIN